MGARPWAKDCLYIARTLVFLLMGASEIVDGQGWLVSMSKAGSKPRLILGVFWEQATLTEPRGSLFCPPLHVPTPAYSGRKGSMSLDPDPAARPSQCSVNNMF